MLSALVREEILTWEAKKCVVKSMRKRRMKWGGEKLSVSIVGYGHNTRLFETTKAIVNHTVGLPKDSNSWIQLKAFLKGAGVIHSACLTAWHTCMQDKGRNKKNLTSNTWTEAVLTCELCLCRPGHHHKRWGDTAALCVGHVEQNQMKAFLLHQQPQEYFRTHSCGKGDSAQTNKEQPKDDRSAGTM